MPLMLTLKHVSIAFSLVSPVNRHTYREWLLGFECARIPGNWCVRVGLVFFGIDIHVFRKESVEEARTVVTTTQSGDFNDPNIWKREYFRAGDGTTIGAMAALNMDRDNGVESYPEELLAEKDIQAIVPPEGYFFAPVNEPLPSPPEETGLLYANAKCPNCEEGVMAIFDNGFCCTKCWHVVRTHTVDNKTITGAMPPRA